MRTDAGLGAALAREQEQAAAELTAWRQQNTTATTPLHAVAEAGAQDVLLKGWQAGLDEAVRAATDAAHRKGLDARGTRRAAARAADGYLRKHPRP